jgi:hypothetical protein
MSLGNVYHCAYDRSPWIILFGSFDPIGTARGDLLYSYYYYYHCIWAHSARSTGFRLDLYPILHLDFILGLFRMLA